MVLTGCVVPGKRLGRTLGFPTANILPDDPNVSAQLPENGVYFGKITLEDGTVYPCVLNQGRHPTVPEGPPTIEAHLLDYRGDLYGAHVTLAYGQQLRPERRFENVEALREQIARDVRRARKLLGRKEEKG